MIREVLLASVVFAAACRGEKSPKPEPAATAGAAGAVGAGAGSNAGAGSAAAAGPGSAQQPPEDPKVREAYRLGLRKGRKETRAKRYQEAIAGFDAALAAKPNDARALGERGYARLLEGADLDAAMRDFDLAASGTKDPQVLSEVWFNRGLVEEKRGSAANAIAAFTIANTLRPTKAAGAKLAGKTTCPVTETGSWSNINVGPIEAKGWLELAKATPNVEGDELETAAEAIQALAKADREPALPALIVAGDYDQQVAYVVWKRGASLRAQPVGMAIGGRCPGQVAGSIEKADAAWIHARVTEEFMGGYTYMCQGKDDELVECQGKDDEVSAGTACLGGSPTIRDVAIERASGNVALVLEQPDGTTVNVELAAGGLKLSGLGCDRTVPFAAR